MSDGLVVRLPFDPGVELVPVDAGAVSHGNAERRPIGTFVVLITVAGGAVGESVRLAAITDFTHLAEPDGSLYPHLVADALTALALVLGLGADRDTALKALTSFKPGGHRIETVAEAAVEGGSVRFVDDSKATNGHAARASLSSFPAKSVIWIAGGLAKGSRFEDLVKDQAHTIKAAVIIGKIGRAHV